MQLFGTIGDFARATHLSVKKFRHYRERGLLVSAEVDACSGYRRYAAAQISIAQVIRRIRELDMPLDEIRAVVGAPPDARAVIAPVRRVGIGSSPRLSSSSRRR